MSRTRKREPMSEGMKNIIASLIEEYDEGRNELSFRTQVLWALSG